MENVNLKLIEFESSQKNIHSGLSIKYVFFRACAENLHEWILKHVSGIKLIGTVANCGSLAMAVSSTLCRCEDTT
jgi:hypothetical protein